MRKFIGHIVFIILLAGIVFYSFYSLGKNELTARETLLVGFIQTILSIVVGWLISDIYFQNENKKNISEIKTEYQASLKTYALNAAEKVQNLSKELNRLSSFLRDFQNEIQNPKIENALTRYEEKLDSVTHIIETLKSVNDTSLSDWKGVIGEELNEKKEELNAQEERFKELLTQYQEIIRNDEWASYNPQTSLNPQDRALGEVKKQLGYVLASLNDTSLTIPRVARNKRTDVEINCPTCQAKLKYRQKPRITAYKRISCHGCSSELASRWNEPRGFHLEKIEEKDEAILCPKCDQQNTLKLSTGLNEYKLFKCSQCIEPFKVVRSKDGIRVIQQTSSKVSKSSVIEPSDELIDSVMKLLPPQPWPKGIHIRVGEQLGVPAKTVQSIMNDLIRKGVYKIQQDGILYVRES